jgi:hypothetical protein
MPKKAKPKVKSADKSMKQLREDAMSIYKAGSATWGIAAKAALMLKKPKFVGTGKAKKRATMLRNGEEVPVPTKTNRCLRKNAIKTLFSAAGYAAAQRLRREADAMEVPIKGEYAAAVGLPGYQRGVELMLEHALVAYAQTVFDTAVRIKRSMNGSEEDGTLKQGGHKKVTSACMQAACQIVNSSVFATAGIAPGVIIPSFVKPRKKAKKAAKPEAGAEGAEGATAEAAA